MEHIPAIHAAKVGMRCPARVTAVWKEGLFLELDLSGIAPGRSPVLPAILRFDQTLSTGIIGTSRLGERFEVAVVRVQLDGYTFASLPADPAWLAWDHGTVRQLARRVRETGETVLLPMLADALEEAGCTERDLLVRCRNPDNDDLGWLVTLLATQE